MIREQSVQRAATPTIRGLQSLTAAMVLAAVGSALIATPAMAQAAGDQKQQASTPPQTPPQPPPAVVPTNGSGNLGGVRAKFPTPYRTPGSLLEQRMRPMPKLVNPAPPQQPGVAQPAMDPNKPMGVWPSTPDTSNAGGLVRPTYVDPVTGVPVYTDTWLWRQRAIATGGVTLQVGSDGVRRVTISSGSPVGAMVVPLDSVYKYPMGWYRSYWNECGSEIRRIGCGYGGMKDAFVSGGDQPAGFLGVASDNLAEIDKAEIAMKQGEWRLAVKNYRDHIELAPSDADAVRMMGVALVLDGAVGEGVMSIALGLERDPSLGKSPIPTSAFEREYDLRHATSLVMNYAARARTKEAYLASSMLKFSEGAKDVARRMLDRAAAAGLSAEIEAPLREALTKKTK